MEHNEIDAIKKEVKKEFELERLKLFSDAVFAIVITMVAIEIKLPHFEEEVTEKLLKNTLLHLVPVIISYIVSFIFIGVYWYSHFKLFSVLKTAGQNDFDKAFFIAVQELKSRASILEADAIVSMRQDIDLDTNGFQHFYLQMYGTAVKFK